MTKLPIIFAFIALAGCAPASDLVEVTGDVTWNGAPMPSGMVVLQPRDKTLTDAEIEALSARIVAAAEKAVGAKLRT